MLAAATGWVQRRPRETGYPPGSVLSLVCPEDGRDKSSERKTVGLKKCDRVRKAPGDILAAKLEALIARNLDKISRLRLKRLLSCSAAALFPGRVYLSK